MIGGRSALLGASGGNSYGNWTGNYSDVSLLLRNGTPRLVPFDESPTPKTLTVVGDAGISTTTFKYGDSALTFDGSGDYFSTPLNTAFDFGTGDFTIECWVNLNTLAGDQGFVSYAAGTSATLISFGLERLTSGAFRCYIYSGTTFYVVTVSPAISTGTWYHVAGVRSGGQLRCYVNGVGGAAISANVSVNAASGRILTVGAFHTSLRFTNGFIDDLRITKGVARYTADFTPPTAELPANITDDPSYNSVSLLLRSGTPGPLDPFDESPTPKTLTVVGNAGISTATFKYGGSAFTFDGSGDYFSTPLNTAFDFGTGDFTIECWVNLNTLAGDQSFVSYASGTSAASTSFVLERLTSGAFRCYIYSVSTAYIATVSPAISTGTWYHVAGVRSGGQLRCYVNGVGGAAISANVSVNAASGRILTVGALHTSLRFTNGFIDDLRITKGVARYTKNFLPPPAQLPAI